MEMGSRRGAAPGEGAAACYPERARWFMRTLALVTALFLLTPTLAHADASKSGHRKKVSGGALIGIGVPFAIAGSVLLTLAAVFQANPSVPSSCGNTGPCGGTTSLSPTLTFPGGLATGVAGLAFVAGIPLYVVGDVEERRPATVSVAELRF